MSLKRIIFREDFCDDNERGDDVVSCCVHVCGRFEETLRQNLIMMYSFILPRMNILAIVGAGLKALWVFNLCSCARSTCVYLFNICSLARSTYVTGSSLSSVLDRMRGPVEVALALVLVLLIRLSGGSFSLPKQSGARTAATGARLPTTPWRVSKVVGARTAPSLPFDRVSSHRPCPHCAASPNRSNLLLSSGAHQDVLPFTA